MKFCESKQIKAKLYQILTKKEKEKHFQDSTNKTNKQNKQTNKHFPINQQLIHKILFFISMKTFIFSRANELFDSYYLQTKKKYINVLISKKIPEFCHFITRI